MDFYEKQNYEIQSKIEWTLGLIRDLDIIPIKYFKYITSSEGLFEVKVHVGTNIFRIFSFFDKGNLVVLANAFQKKSQKTPKQEIELAQKIMKEYFDEKK